MPTVIQAILPYRAIDAALTTLGGSTIFFPEFGLFSAPWTTIDSFKVGEGGFEITPSGNVPRDPTEGGAMQNRGPYLTDLDVIENPADYPAASGYFQKALVGGDFSYDNVNKILEVTCLLDFGDFNDDGFGNPPEIYEIGLFAGTVMVAYGTMTQQVKTPGVQIPNIVRISATGS